MGAVSSSVRKDTLQYDNRLIGKDEPLEYELDNSDFDSSRVTLEKVKQDAMVFRNILTPDECAHLLKHMFPDKRNPNKTHRSYPILFRDWEPDPEEAYKKIGVRVFTSSEQVAQALFERIKSHLPQLWTCKSPKETMLERWTLKGLHHRIRFVCYGKGQNFPPHRDDPWVQSDSCRSHLTFVLYLSSSGDRKDADFSGGEFAFVEPSPESTLMKDRYVLAPEPGLAVVFPHREMHESKVLTKGFKFMIRSDVMFDLESAEPILGQGPESTTKA